MGRERKLLFILADRLSSLVQKGEVIPRYYNPGDFFAEIHLLTTSNDWVEPEQVAAMAGGARVFVHRLWRGDDRLNMALSPLLERIWARRAVDLARSIDPDLVRTGDRLTGYLGNVVKKALGIPHIVSLHTHRDETRRRTRWGPRRLMMEFESRYARIALSQADAVIIVYETIREYARNNGSQRIEKIFNVISPERMDRKENYTLSPSPRIVSVGRQLPRKQPDQLILACEQVDAELLLIGDGPCHRRLRRLVEERGLDQKVRFQSSMANAQVCAILPEFDLFAVHTHYPEFPKTVMEALWLGLPVLINEDQAIPVPELQGDWVCKVPNTAEGYASGLRQLLRDRSAREELGHKGRKFAEAAFDPREMENRMVRLYAEFVL